MANAEMKIFEAEKLHQPIMAAVNKIPTDALKRRKTHQDGVSDSCFIRDQVLLLWHTYCKEKRTPKLERRIMGRRQ